MSRAAAAFAAAALLSNAPAEAHESHRHRAAIPSRSGIAAADEAQSRHDFAAARSELDRLLAADPRDLEARLMSLPTGMQDRYPALLGGSLEILQSPGGERVRRLDVDLERLGDSLLVVYSGASHFSAGNNWQVVRRRLDGEAEVTELLQGIAAAAADLSPALESGDLPRVGELMSREWSFRRRLAEGSWMGRLGPVTTMIAPDQNSDRWLGSWPVPDPQYAPDW